MIEQLLHQKRPEPQLYNLNIPTAALSGTPRLRIVPMDVTHYGERFEKRIDPWGRAYYWATGEPPPPLGERETDLAAIAQGFVTLTPLDYNMTRQMALAEMRAWQFSLDSAAGEGQEQRQWSRPIVMTARKKGRAADDGRNAVADPSAGSSATTESLG